MKCFIAAIAVLVCACVALPRGKRAAYLLPDGAELIVGPIKTTFTCPGFGYYADVDNGCKIFHVCNTVLNADGSESLEQHSFMCGNLTVFSQMTMTCADPDDAIPCGSSSEFFRLNARIGQVDALFLNDDDVEKGNALIRQRKQ